jgi:hypothetical protein
MTTNTNSLEKFSFALNECTDYKVSKCPLCQKATFKRKFPLVIHIDGNAGLLNLGLTCKYCAKCEFIIANKHELEIELTIIFEKRAPSCIGNEYLILGTSDKKYWKKQVENMNPENNKSFQIIKFKSRYTL